MPIDNKPTFLPNDNPFVADDQGVIIGMIGKNGKKIFFPASLPADLLTALAGGAQGGAGQLLYRVNRVTTVATAADSVTLPKALAGMSMTVVNASGGVLAMNVFPATGESINLLSANTALSVAANKAIIFTSPANGLWVSNLTA